MKIILLCEGATEAAIRKSFKTYMDNYCADEGINPVSLEIKPFGHAVNNFEKLSRRLKHYATKSDLIGVIALTDVYPEFESAEKAKGALLQCVEAGPIQIKFHAHAALHELEAWLLPFWQDIVKRQGIKSAKAPGANPEQVNHEKPPSMWFKELYRKSPNRRGYEKNIEAPKILTAERIEEAAGKCPELKSLLDTLKKLCKQAT